MSKRIGYKSIIDLGREARVYPPHDIGDYPTKILPQVMGEFIERFSKEGDIVLDPFAGSGTVAVESAMRKRISINSDINTHAIDIAKDKIKRLNASMFKNGYESKQILLIADARRIPMKDESVDLIITDIPYADMIKYSDHPLDLSNIENYDEFLEEIGKAFMEMHRVLKRDKYCVIFVADYRIARSRMILPIHSDVILLMQNLGFVLFDLYVWRYYRSGGFRPFGSPPYQAMNVHSYVLVFYKPKGEVNIVKNRPVRYRKRLIEKLQKIRSK